MDYNEIRNSNLQLKSKSEITEFLVTSLTQFDLSVEFEMLKEFLSPDDFSKIDKFVEKDTRDDIQENNPDMEESEILEWIDADKKNRPLGFRTNEEGKVMITDRDSRMQENPDVVDLKPEEIKLAVLVELVRQGILYKQTHLGYRENLSSERELQELENRLKILSEELRDLDSVKRRVISGDKSENLLLEVARIGKAGFSVNELESLVSPNAAVMAKMIRTAEAEQTYKPNEFFSQKDVDKLKIEYIDRDVYMVNINQRSNSFELSPRSQTLPNLNLDTEKMNTPEFRETLRSAIARRKSRLGEMEAGFIFDELTEIFEYALATDEKATNVDEKGIRDAAISFAKNPEVIREISTAEQALGKVQEKFEKGIDENQTDFVK